MYNIINEEKIEFEVIDYPICLTKVRYGDEACSGIITKIDIPMSDEQLEELSDTEACKIVIEIFKYSERLYAGMCLLEVPVTKQLAKIFMKTNLQNNRTMKKKNFNKIKKAVEDNRYESTGDAAKFTVEGQMGDGNHRITAISESEGAEEVPILQLLYGITLLQLKHVDTGNSRSMGDRMQILSALDTPGCAIPASTYKVASAIMSLVYFFFNNEVSFLKAPSHVQEDLADYISQLMTQNKSLCIEASRFGSFASRTKKWGGSSIIGFCYYIIVDAHPTIGKRFFHDLRFQEGLPRNSPVNYLGDRLMKNKDAGKLTEGQKNHKVVHYTFQAFKAYRENNNRPRYLWKKDDSKTLQLVIDCI